MAMARRSMRRTARRTSRRTSRRHAAVADAAQQPAAPATDQSQPMQAQTPTDQAAPAESDPKKILAERLAKGEITPGQYKELLAALDEN